MEDKGISWRNYFGCNVVYVRLHFDTLSDHLDLHRVEWFMW